MASRPSHSSGDAWTSERTDGNKAKIIELVQGIKDVGNAKVKNLNKDSSKAKGSRGASRSLKALQLQSKLTFSKPVPRSHAQIQEAMDARDDQVIQTGPHFMPSENPASTLIAQINSGSSRLTPSQSEYLETLNQKQPGISIVPTVDIGCGFFHSDVPAEVTKRNNFFMETKAPIDRKAINLRKSQSMMAPKTNTFRGTRHPRLNGSLSSVSSDSSGASVKSMHESFKPNNDLLPVYDLSEIEADNSQVDLVLPGVCGTTTPRRPLVRSATTVNCRSQYDSDYYQRPKDMLDSIVSDVPFTIDKQTCDCDQCHHVELKSKPPVQYCHGDVIKTFEWLSEDTKETSL